MNDIINHLHVIIYILLVFSYLILPKNIINKYGIYISIYILFIIISWNICDGKCILTKFQHDNNIDSETINIIKKYTNFHNTTYKYLDILFDFLFSLSAFLLANKYKKIQLLILLNSLYYFINFVKY